ncbi:hypothetical protein EDD85DRAFT_793909 [Armillaria nabsnona]|nr:hypothetical protein EDD85DRAFT_793909 [Armillaria nabsnona]
MSRLFWVLVVDVRSTVSEEGTRGAGARRKTIKFGKFFLRISEQNAMMALKESSDSRSAVKLPPPPILSVDSLTVPSSEKDSRTLVICFPLIPTRESKITYHLEIQWYINQLSHGIASHCNLKFYMAAMPVAPPTGTYLNTLSNRKTGALKTYISFGGVRMLLFPIWVLVALVSDSVAMQDLKPSTSWTNTNNTLSRHDRISITRKGEVQLNSGKEGRLYAQMAEFDRLTNQTKYKDMLMQYLASAELVQSDFLDELNYGYAAARAYAAYRDPYFLNLAVTSCTSARRYTISVQQAASGTMDIKQLTLAISCQGATLAGGTYWSYTISEPKLASLASGFITFSVIFVTWLTHFNQVFPCVGAWLTKTSVSALLAEATSDHMYLDAAIEIYIEGLAILADITHNTSTEALLRSTIVAITTNNLWQELNGVIATTTTGGHYIVQALAAFYEHNKTPSDLREYIKEYISVQYNAVIEQTTSGGSNIYGIPWTGPPNSTFSPNAQTVALTALIGSIQLTDDQVSLDGSAPSSKRNLAGIIAGGGIRLLEALIAGVLFLFKRWSVASSWISRERQQRNQLKSTQTHRVANIEEPSSSGVVETGVVETTRVNIQPVSTPSREAHSGSSGSVNSPRSSGDRRVNALLEEVLTLLHEGLRPGRRDAGEQPPEYRE